MLKSKLIRALSWLSNPLREKRGDKPREGPDGLPTFISGEAMAQMMRDHAAMKVLERLRWKNSAITITLSSKGHYFKPHAQWTLTIGGEVAGVGRTAREAVLAWNNEVLGGPL